MGASRRHNQPDRLMPRAEYVVVNSSRAAYEALVLTCTIRTNPTELFPRNDRREEPDSGHISIVRSNNVPLVRESIEPPGAYRTPPTAATHSY